MRKFNDVNEMWLAMLSQAFAGAPLDSRDGPSRETLGWVGRLEDASRNYLTVPGRKFSPSYAGAEVVWYLGQHDANTEMIAFYAPSYSEWTEPDGAMYGGYGKRLFNQPGFVEEWARTARQDGATIAKVIRSGDPADASDVPTDQIGAAVKLLREKPNTRQCVITLWDSGDLIHAVLGDKQNVPCTVLFQLLARDDKLHMVAYMRSNDAWLGAPYDLWSFTCIQHLIAGAAGLEVGSYTHVVGSLHVYDRHYEKAQRLLSSPESERYDDRKVWHEPSVDPLTEAADWLKRETAVREGQTTVKDALAAARNESPTLLRDCFVMALSKHVDKGPARDLVFGELSCPRLIP